MPWGSSLVTMALFKCDLFYESIGFLSYSQNHIMIMLCRHEKPICKKTASQCNNNVILTKKHRLDFYCEGLHNLRNFQESADRFSYHAAMNGDHWLTGTAGKNV